MLRELIWDRRFLWSCFRASQALLWCLRWSETGTVKYLQGSGISEPAFILYFVRGHLKWLWSIPSPLHCLHHIWWWLPRAVCLCNYGCVFVPSSFALRSGCSLLPKLTQLLSFLFEESSATWYLSFSLLCQSFLLEREYFLLFKCNIHPKRTCVLKQAIEPFITSLGDSSHEFFIFCRAHSRSATALCGCTHVKRLLIEIQM